MSLHHHQRRLSNCHRERTQEGTGFGCSWGQPSGQPLWGSDVGAARFHLPLPQLCDPTLKALLSPQMKCSHLVLPWRAQELFSTEQKDAFTPKARGPAEIQTGDSQVSRVPLGTLKGYCPQRKVVFAP